MADDAPAYSAEIASLREALASGVLTVESNGRRKTYRSVAEIQLAIADFERLAGVTPRRRRGRMLAVSMTSGR